MDMDLSDLNLKKHVDTFCGLKHKPSFSISDDTDVHILFFKRRDKYFGIWTGQKSKFESRSQFLVTSVLIEKIRARINDDLVLQNLSTVECTPVELKRIFARAVKIKKYLPTIGEIEHPKIVISNSDLNWVFLEAESQYHSLFWNESESRLFSHSA